MAHDPDACLARGVAFLQRAQRADGGFDSFSSPSQRPFRAAHTYDTVFVPAIILGALSGMPETKDIRSRLVPWLLAQRSAGWSFNYWSAAAPERQTMPYPDDLDDTFCALIGLLAHDPSLIDAGALGAITRLLVAAESQVGGPYRTWLVGEQAPAVWQDIDFAVNCNIAYFVRQVAQPLPNLMAMIERAAAANTFTSPYYPSAFPLLYFAARAYRGPHAAALVARIQDRQRSGHWGSVLRTALAVSALAELGYKKGVEQALAFLYAAQQPDGSWPAEAFCIDPARGGKRFYQGAAALTTALVLEALRHHRRGALAPAGQRSTTPAPLRAGGQAAAPLATAVFTTAHRSAKNLPQPLRQQFKQLVQRLADSRSGSEITLLPTLFASSLHEKQKVPAALTHRLGVANLFGWTAYTVYDNILDGAGNPQDLPAANVALRSSVAEFLACVPASAEWQALVSHTFTVIDNANAWEMAECRWPAGDGFVVVGAVPSFGQLGRLAERSLGHALPALGVLAHLGTTPGSAPAKAVLAGCKHYLIARQLLDDLHDWEDDLCGGRCTYVVARLLTAAAIPAGRYDTRPLVHKLKPIFWQKVLGDVSAVLLRHTRQARLALKRSGLLTEAGAFVALVDDLELATKRTLQEERRAEAFLSGYTQKP